MRPLANFSVYTLGSVLQTAISFLLLPVYLKYLSPGEYGVIAILLVTFSILSLMTSLGLPSGFYRLYFDGRREALLATALAWRVSATLVVLAVLTPLAARVSSGLFKTEDYRLAVVYVGISVVVTAFHELVFLTLRLQQRAGLFVGYSLFLAVLTFGLKYFYLVELKQGVNGYWLSQVLAEAGMAVVMILHLRVVTRLARPSIALLREMFRVGFPYTFSTIGVWVIDSAGKLLLNMMVGLAAVGVYSLATRIASLFNVLITTPLQLWWGPFAFEKAARDGVDVFKRISRRFTELALVAAILGTCLLPLAGLVIGLFPGHAEYRQAIPLVVFCTIPLALQALLIGFGAQFTQMKKTHYAGIAGVLSSVLSVVVNVVLLPRMGLAGAVVAPIAAYALWLVIYFLAAQRELPVEHDRVHILRHAGIFGVYMFILVAVILSRKNLYIPIWVALSLFTALITMLMNRNRMRPFLDEIKATLCSFAARQT